MKYSKASVGRILVNVFNSKVNMNIKDKHFTSDIVNVKSSMSWTGTCATLIINARIY